jgi:hypothetical protein
LGGSEFLADTRAYVGVAPEAVIRPILKRVAQVGLKRVFVASILKPEVMLGGRLGRPPEANKWRGGGQQTVQDRYWPTVALPSSIKRLWVVTAH